MGAFTRRKQEVHFVAPKYQRFTKSNVRQGRRDLDMLAATAPKIPSFFALLCRHHHVEFTAEQQAEVVRGSFHGRRQRRRRQGVRCHAVRRRKEDAQAEDEAALQVRYWSCIDAYVYLLLLQLLLLQLLTCCCCCCYWCYYCFCCCYCCFYSYCCYCCFYSYCCCYCCCCYCC